MFNCVRQTRFKQRSGVEAWKKHKKRVYSQHQNPSQHVGSFVLDPKGLLQPEPENSGMSLSTRELELEWLLWHLLAEMDGFNMDLSSRERDILLDKVGEFEVLTTVFQIWHLGISRNVVSFATATESCCVPFQCGSSNIGPGKKRRACVMYIYIVYIYTHI